MKEKSDAIVHDRGFDNLRIFDRAVPLFPITDVARIIKAMYVLLSKTVLTKMNNHGLLRVKWAKLTTLMMMAIIIFVVDASILERETREFVDHNISEGKKKPKDFADERITYEGDQVWRIHKDNSTVDELVERYDEYGCT